MGECGSVLTILLTHGTKYINCFTSNTGISESYGFMGDTSGKNSSARGSVKQLGTTSLNSVNQGQAQYRPSMETGQAQKV